MDPFDVVMALLITLILLLLIIIGRAKTLAQFEAIEVRITALE